LRRDSSRTRNARKGVPRHGLSRQGNGPSGASTAPRRPGSERTAGAGSPDGADEPDQAQDHGPVRKRGGGEEHRRGQHRRGPRPGGPEGRTSGPRFSRPEHSQAAQAGTGTIAVGRKIHRPGGVSLRDQGGVHRLHHAGAGCGGHLARPDEDGGDQAVPVRGGVGRTGRSHHRLSARHGRRAASPRRNCCRTATGP